LNQYITGSIIKKYREKKNMTQQKLADLLNVSDKAVSKWETGKGYPDITLIEPLAKALGLSVVELLSGNDITNSNRSTTNVDQTRLINYTIYNALCRKYKLD
jgi:transcriptional regulator with XRE-family HTH domain